MSKKLIKKTLVKGGLIGLILNVILIIVLFVVSFSGQCGFNLGFLGGAYPCTFLEAIVNPDGFLTYFVLWFITLWWVVLIIFLLSILGTYLYYKRKK